MAAPGQTKFGGNLMKAIVYTKYSPMEKDMAIGKLPPKPF